MRAYFVKKTTKADGGIRFTFDVDVSDAVNADREIGMPDPTKPKLYEINQFKDAESPYYKTEETL